MKKTGQGNWWFVALGVFLLTQGCVSAAHSEVEMGVSAKEESVDISAEDLEVVRQMGMLEEMELLNQEDVSFLSKVEEAETMADDEVDDEKE